MPNIALLAILTLSFWGQDSTPQTTPPPKDEGIVVKGKKDAREKRVCKSAVATGSIVPKVTCKAAVEWEYERERALAARDAAMQAKKLEDSARLQGYEN